MSKLLDYTGLQYYHGKVEGEISQLRQEIPNIIDNLIDGGTDDALSAEQGVVLDNKIIGLYQYFESQGQKVPYVDKQWLDTAYGIGDNLVTVNGTNYPYNGWAPNCAHYDYVRQRIMFLQCHRTSHTGTYTNSQLWAIDPYNLLDAELIAEFEPYSSNKIVPLAFDIDSNGVYWVMDRAKIYKSTDRGLTWTVRNFTTAFDYSYGLYIINGKFYAARDGGQNDIYCTSVDEGVTWEEHHFNIDSSYNAGNEAVFCEFKGNLYATLRREAAASLLLKYSNGTWEVLSDQLPCVTSDCHLFATKDKLLYAAIDRPNRVLSYGNIEISGNSVTVHELFSFDASTITSDGDFHCPCLVYTTEFAAITFMTGGFNNGYVSANNACLVSYFDYSMNENRSMTIDSNGVTCFGWSSYKATPYIGTAPTVNTKGYVTAVTNANIYDSDLEIPNTYPMEGTNRVAYFPSLSINKVREKFDTKVIDGVGYGGFVKSVSDSYPAYAKILYRCNKTLTDTSSIGTVVPSDGVFSHATAVNTSANAYASINVSNNIRIGNPIKTAKIPEDNRVVFTAIDDCVFTLTIPSAITPRMYHHICYSTDGGKTWVKTLNVTSTEVTVTTPTIPAGKKVLWKGMGCCMATSSSVYSNFASTGRFKLSGNALALFHNDHPENAIGVATRDYEMCSLFRGNTGLTEVSATFLPALIVGARSYDHLFSGCSNLTSVPDLPATIVGAYAYDSFCSSCTSLVTAMEELPATVLTEYTYRNMFYGDTALTTAPIIRAEYFRGSGNCQYMFNGCSSLAYVKLMMLDDATQSLTLQHWLTGVAASGILVINSAAQWTPASGASGLPSGWTLTTASE